MSKKWILLMLFAPSLGWGHNYSKAEVAKIYRSCQAYLRASPAAQAASSAKVHRAPSVDRKSCTEITRRSLAEDQRQMVGPRRGGGLVPRPSIGDTDSEGKGSGPIVCSGGKCSTYGSGQQPDLDCGTPSAGSSNYCRTKSGTPTSIRCDTDSGGSTSCH